MLFLVIGNENSGKSQYAEELSVRLYKETGSDRLIYAATMKNVDKISDERIVRHRRNRQGKGFFTIEHEKNILGILDKYEGLNNSTILLECMSNLVGNELFDSDSGSIKSAARLAFEVTELSRSVRNIVVVSNEYEKNAASYDDETRRYVDLLHEVNRLLVKEAYEVKLMGNVRGDMYR